MTVPHLTLPVSVFARQARGLNKKRDHTSSTQPVIVTGWRLGQGRRTGCIITFSVRVNHVCRPFVPRSPVAPCSSLPSGDGALRVSNVSLELQAVGKKTSIFYALYPLIRQLCTG